MKTILTGKKRLRIYKKKLILQVETENTYCDNDLDSYTDIYWRDATVEDLSVFTENITLKIKDF